MKPKLFERHDYIEIRQRNEGDVCRAWQTVLFECRADGYMWVNSHSATELGFPTEDLDPYAVKHTVLYWLRLICGVQQDLYELCVAKALDISEHATYNSFQLFEQSHSWKEVAEMVGRFAIPRTYT